MATEIWCALIAGGVGIVTTLITAIGSFQMSVKKDREKAKEELKAELIKYHEKNQQDILDLKEDVTAMGANLQQKIAIIEVNINTLSDRVEKHNGVIDRVYRCEERIEVSDERQRVANHRIDDLEHKVG